MAPTANHQQRQPHHQAGGCSGGSPLKNLVPRCDGSYGQDVTASSDVYQNAAPGLVLSPQQYYAAAAGMATSTGVPPVEDVIRWKEFRRRQKMETFQHQLQEKDAKFHEFLQHQQRQQQLRSPNKGRAAGEGEDWPSIDSLSLSLSESTLEHYFAGGGSVASAGHVHLNQDGSNNGPSPSSRSDSASMGGEGGAVVSIDADGFPIYSPTSLNSVELRPGKSTEEDVGDAVAPNESALVESKRGRQGDRNADNNNSGHVGEAVKYIATLDAASPKSEGEVKHIGSASSAPSPPLSDVPSSEVPTEVVSNTARYVAGRSKSMARRIMSVDAGNGADVGGPVTDSNPGQPSSTPSSREMRGWPTPRSASGAATTPGAAETPGWDPTRTTVRNDMLESVLATPKDNDVNVDDTGCSSENVGAKIASKEEELPLSPSMEPILEPMVEEAFGEGPGESTVDEQQQQELDVSTVSSNWDPLQVSTIQEEEDEKLATKSSPLEETRDSQRSGGSDRDIPTLDEVTNFMSQLKLLREENSSPPKQKGSESAPKTPSSSFAQFSTGSPAVVVEGMVHLPAASEEEVLVKEENVQFARSLMERKERLRMHKLDSARKKRELDERLRAIRSRVYDDSGDGGDDGVESKTSMLPGADLTPLKPAVLSTPSKEDELGLNEESTAPNNGCFPTDEKAKEPLPPSSPYECVPTDEKKGRHVSPSKTSFVGEGAPSLSFSPMVPGARWSGGLARWGNSPPAAVTTESPSPNQDLTTATEEQKVKLNIAIDEDDFSFKPPSLAGAGIANNIVISPIVAGNAAAEGAASTPSKTVGAIAAASTRFNFTLSPEEKPTSPMGTLLSSIGNAASSKLGMSSLAQQGEKTSKLTLSPTSKISLSPVKTKQQQFSRIVPLPNAQSPSAATKTNTDGGVFSSSTPREQLGVLSQRLSPPNAPKPLPSVAESPIKQSHQPLKEPPTDVKSEVSSPCSEGDKGAGLGGFGSSYPNLRGLGDKSIVTTTSSKFVELGQRNSSHDPPDEEDAEEDDESCSTSCSSPSLLGVTVVGSKKKKKKSKRKKMAKHKQAFETVNENDLSMCSTQESDGSCSSRKPLDPDGFDWKEIDAKRKEEEATVAPPPPVKTAAAVSNHKKSAAAPAPSLHVVQEEKEQEEFAAVMDRAKLCLTPKGGTSKPTPTSYREQQRQKPVLSLDVVPEGGDNAEFDAVMDRVKTCLTPKVADSTPRSIQSSYSQASGRFGSTKKKGNINALKSMFESSDNASSQRGSPSKRAVSVGRGRFMSSNKRDSLPRDAPRSERSESAARSWMNESKEKVDEEEDVPPAPPTPPSEFAASEEKDDAQLSLAQSKSSDAMSIKELRSRFESQNAPGRDSSSQKLSEQDEVPLQSQFRCPSSMIRGSSMIGSGIYLKNRDIQAMSSLGSETFDTSKTSLNRAETNDGTDGDGVDIDEDGTLDTKKVLRYAKILEKRGQLPQETPQETESLKSCDNSIEKKDTTSNNSTKENDADKAAAPNTNANGNTSDSNAPNDFPGFSPVKMRKKAFESSKVKGTVAQAREHFMRKVCTPERKNASEMPKPQVVSKETDASSSEKDKPPPAPQEDVTPQAPKCSAAPASTPIQGESPATSVRDRIAAFGGKVAGTTSGKVQSKPAQQASSSKPVVPFQQQTQNGVNRGPKKVPLQQQQAQQTNPNTPPRSVAMNKTTAETPSPLWVANNRNTGGQPAFSPMDSFNSPSKPIYGKNSNSDASPHVKPNVVGRLHPRHPFNKSSPVKFPAYSPLPGKNASAETNTSRPAPVQTRYDSPPRGGVYDDDDEDGITLSPTFSEVSGLTLPTCLGAVNEDSASVFDNTSRNGTLYHETMSPIARHRQKQQFEKSSFPHSNGAAKLTNHPYLQRVNSSNTHQQPSKCLVPAPTEDRNDNVAANVTRVENRMHELKTPRARGSPGFVNQGNSSLATNGATRRQQLVSKVRSSPRNKSLAHQQSTTNFIPKQVEQKGRTAPQPREKSPVRHFLPETTNKTPPEKMGMVAERVANVNKKMKKEQQQSQQRPKPPHQRPSRHSFKESDQGGNSLATRDCIRVD